MRVGVIGTGRMGSERIEHCMSHPGTDLVWIVSRDPEKASGIAGQSRAGNKHHDVMFFRTDEEAFSRGSADAVIVTSPNSMHAKTCIQALEKGAHVFCEYPHATTVEDGARIIKLAKRKGLHFHVGLTHRYSSHHKVLKQFCGAGGAFGPARSMTSILCTGNPISRWYDKDQYSGGMFVSSMYHFIDEAVSLFGRVSNVTSSYSAVRDTAGLIKRDTGRCTLTFESEVTSHIHYSRGFAKPGLGSRMFAIFDAGYLESVDGELTMRSPERELQKVPTAGTDSLLADTNSFLTAIDREPCDYATADGAQESLITALRAADFARSASNTP